MAGRVRIDGLAEELSLDDAVEIAYGEDLAWVEGKLRRGLSVLVECDKQITLWLYRAIRERLKDPSAGAPVACRLLAGRAREGERSASVLANVLAELTEAVTQAEPGAVVVVPHLDILTTTTRSGLSMEAREATARLYDNPEVVLLGFKDPSFELPRVIEDVFTAKRSIVGIARERLPRLVLRREARKFGVEEFDPYTLYKFLSGVNAIKLRRILDTFSNRLDFDPANPAPRESLLREIREMTLVGDMEVPRVDLDADIGGYGKVKRRLQSEILELLEKKDDAGTPEAVKAIEGLVPRGIIFSGPPGTGKTYFAKALATAIDATCIVVSGPELKSKWYGESEENLRRIFARARKSAPAVIVFDELDSFATARGMYANTAGVDHSLVNQLLTEMDGFRKEELVFVVGTTNYAESLDPALLRPGRFEFQIEIPWPIEDDRRAIARLYREKFGLDMSDEVLEHLVRRTGGLIDSAGGPASPGEHDGANQFGSARWTGDHIQALFRALKRKEIRDPGFEVTEAEVDEAIGGRADKRVFTAEEERTIAFHESGHALCSMLLPEASAVEKVSIATGEEDTLGYVLREVRRNRYVTTRAELLDDIGVLLGGRIAEKMKAGQVSVGAYDDLRKASELARMMIEELGMGEGLDPRTFTGSSQREGEIRRPVSQERSREIDDAIDQVLRTQQMRVQKLLADNEPTLDAIAAALLEKKSLTKEEIAKLVESHRTKAAKMGVI